MSPAERERAELRETIEDMCQRISEGGRIGDGTKDLREEREMVIILRELAAQEYRRLNRRLDTLNKILGA